MTQVLHRRRFNRMVTDLDVHPLSLLPARDGTRIRDDASGRELCLATANITEAEGIVSAIKLAASLSPLLDRVQLLVDAIAEDETNHGGLLSRSTLGAAGELRLELSAWISPRP